MGRLRLRIRPPIVRRPKRIDCGHDPDRRYGRTPFKRGTVVLWNVGPLHAFWGEKINKNRRPKSK